MASDSIHVKGYLVKGRKNWEVKARFRDTPTSEPKLHTKSTGLSIAGNNKRAAEAAMREIVAEWERQANAVQPIRNPKFKDCIEQWFERKELTIRANTLEGYKTAAHAHIIPELGDIGICDLTRQDIQHYYEKLQRDGISPNTMKKHRVIINGVLKDAVLDDLITVNVSDNISLPKGKKYEGKALSEKQVADMLDKLEKQDEPVRAAVTLALAYGLRRSEICGLRWGDIDFTNSVIHIRHTTTQYSGVVYEAEATKTQSSCRDLNLIQSTASYLRELKESQRQSGIYNGKVCVHLDGREVRPEYITRASMRFLKECGIGADYS